MIPAALRNASDWQRLRPHPLVVHGTRHAIRWSVIFSLFLIALIVVLSIVLKLALPYVAGYKDQIEHELGEYLGNPVNIAELDVRWSLTGPVLRADQLTLIEGDGREARFDELLLNVNVPMSVWRQQLQINELTLSGADLVLESAPRGRLLLHGVRQRDVVSSAPTASSNIGRDNSEGLNVLSWLVNANRVSVLDARVTVLDINAEPIRFESLNLRAERKQRNHTLRAEVTLPEDLGSALEVAVDLDGAALSLEDWNGQLYLRGYDIHPAAWARLSDRLAIAQQLLLPMDASVQVELWGELEQGRLGNARGAVIAEAVKNAQGLQVLDRVATRVDYAKTDRGWEARLDETVVELGAERVRPGELQADYVRGREPAWQLIGRGGELPIAPLLTIAERVSQDASGRSILSELEATGQLSQWRLEGYSAGQGGPQWNFSASVKGLHTQASEQWPGIDSIDVSVDGNGASWLLTLPRQSLTVEWPSMFPAPHTLSLVDGEVLIETPGDSKPLRLLGQGSVGDGNAALSSGFEIQFPKGESPRVDIQSVFSAADVRKVRDWLPLRGLPKGVSLWLHDALQGGRVEQGELHWNGTLEDYPYRTAEGTFSTLMKVRDGTIRFLKDWPAATEVDGELEIRPTAIQATVASARVDGIPVRDVKLSIPDLTRAAVRIEGVAESSARQALEFGRKGPLKNILGAPLSVVDANGQVRVDLNLNAPLIRKQDSQGRWRFPPVQVQGAVHLAGNRVDVPAAQLNLRNVIGAVRFDNAGISMRNVKARAFGRDIRINARTDGQGDARATTFTTTGRLEPNDVLVHYAVPMDMFVQGELDALVETRIPYDQNTPITLDIRSDLRGAAVRLGRPFAKDMDSAAELHVQTQIDVNASARDWRFNYIMPDGDRAEGVAHVDEDGLQRLTVALGDSALKPSASVGVQVTGQVSSFELLGWSDALTRLTASLPSGESGRPTMPIRADIYAERLFAGAQSLGPLQVGVSSDERFIISRVDNEHLSGQVRYPRVLDGTATQVRIAHVDATLIRSIADASLAESEANGPSVSIDPRNVPPLDVHADNVQWDKLELSDLALRTELEAAGHRVVALGFATDNTQLIGTGSWRMLDPQGVNLALSGQQETRLHMTLQSSDFGRGLADVGFPGLLADAHGQMVMHLNWPDAIYKPSLEAIDGALELSLNDGSIPLIEPGGARLMGLFALDALPRRLNLDFNDLTRDGLDFQTMKGDVVVSRGMAETELLQISGPVGVIDVSGRTDLVNERYDQRIEVLPRVSAALPLIGAITGGATAGIGALLAGPLFKAIGLDFDRIGYREYTLQGSWDDPVFAVVPVEGGR